MPPSEGVPLDCQINVDCVTQEQCVPKLLRIVSVLLDSSRAGTLVSFAPEVVPYIRGCLVNRRLLGHGVKPTALVFGEYAPSIQELTGRCPVLDLLLSDFYLNHCHSCAKTNTPTP